MNGNMLVVGGTSGLGLEIALQLNEDVDARVFATGRRVPDVRSDITFLDLDIGPSSAKLGEDLDEVLEGVPDPIELVVYAAGFYQRRTIADLGDVDIDTMNNVGLVGAEKLLSRIIRRQSMLTGLILVTSTSEWTPRSYEPAYTGVKAGLAMVGQSVASGHHVERTLVVAPAGMGSNFWAGTDMDTSTMLDPNAVAEETIRLFELNLPYSYAHARILREPPRVEIDELTYGF